MMKWLFKGMMKFIFLLFMLPITCFAADPLEGIWKTIDDRTGYSRADVKIQKKADGSYEGFIVETRSLPGTEKLHICTLCPGNAQNKPFAGLTILWNLTQDRKDPFKYESGQILDPLNGKIYSGYAKLSGTGNRLTIRGYTHGSAIGRSVTWIKY